jgi:hypothetical protein
VRIPNFVCGHAELLFGYALLAEGSEIPEPAKFNRLVVEMALKTL